jgi:ketosteroid isomerase-like protein
MVDMGPESERQQVISVTDEEVTAVSTGDLDRYLAILTEDAVFMPPNLLPKTGNELRRWLGDFLERVSVEYLHFVHGETVVAGDIAYHEYACSWKTTPRGGGESTVAHFKGLHIVRRLPDGSWKVAIGIWNANPEAVVAH